MIDVLTHPTDGAKGSSSIPLPAVFTAPIRLDVVQQIHKSVRS